MQAGNGGSAIEVHDLLLSVAEQLKVPLTVIARQAELGQLDQATSLDVTHVHTQATAALQLVDSYLLGLELVKSQTQLELEPVSIASTLADTAHHLEQFARQYGVELELHIAGKYEPVMAHGRGLRAALLSLGFALSEMVGAAEASRRRVITLAVHRTPQGIVTGMYSGQASGLTAANWRRARSLAGRANQPFAVANSGAGAGFFVADAILCSMQTALRVGRLNRQSGLAASFRPSQQLQFV